VPEQVTDIEFGAGRGVAELVRPYPGDELLGLGECPFVILSWICHAATLAVKLDN
jgi:hypothetical protein